MNTQGEINFPVAHTLLPLPTLYSNIQQVRDKN